MTQEQIQTIISVSGHWGELEQPTVRGQWATWDQQGSRGVMGGRVKRLKDAGYVAFFSASDRRWGVKVDASGNPEKRS